MTSHPKDMSDALIEVIAAPNQVCEHVHLPVQSGSDRILAAMNRRYDRAAYLDLVGRLRRSVPGPGAHHRPHRRLPRRDRGGLPADAVAGGGVPLRRGLHVHLLAAPRARRPRPCRAASSRRRGGGAHDPSGRGGAAPGPRAQPGHGRPDGGGPGGAGQQARGRGGHGPHARAQAGELPVRGGARAIWCGWSLLEATSTSFRGREVR